jgi:CheY-like chemotaxis protein
MPEKRNYPRFNVQLSAQYRTLRSPEEPLRVTVMDIGAEGMRFESDELFDIGQVLELHVALNDEEKTFFKVEVMWLTRAEEGKYNIGVKIVDGGRGDQARFIRYYCEKMLSLSSQGPKKILIVDDEPDMVRLLQIELEKESYDVILAYDGEEGYEKYMNEHPNLIILDMTMPKMNGRAVCRKIRMEQGDSETPIVMLTAKGDEADKIIGRVVGAQKYITKPFDMQELLTTVEGLLG